MLGGVKPLTLAALAVASACGDPSAAAPAGPIDGGRAATAPPAVDAAATVVDAVPPPSPPRRAEQVVFRFGDNRLLAHQQASGALFIPAGSPGFAKYVRFAMPVPRWALRQQRDGIAVAAADRLAAIEVPLTAAQAASARAVALTLYSGAARTLTLKVNGRSAGAAAQATLVAGWQSLELGVAAGRLQAGENFLAFESGGGTPLEIATVAVHAGSALPARSPGAAAGPAAAPLAAAAPPPSIAGPIGRDEADDAFVLADGAGLAWYLLVPPEANLVVDEVTGDGDGVAGRDCAVTLSAHTAEGKEVTGTLRGKSAAADLAPLAGAVARVELTASGCPATRMRGATLTIPGEPPSVDLAVQPPKYVVLWVMDALRADRVRPFTPGARAEVPNLEKLAAAGAVFRQYWVQGNESQTSHASVWTSLYPANHDVRTAGNGGTYRIHKRFDVLGRLIAAGGMTPVAVTGNGMVTDSGGYARGFASFRNMMREKGVMNGILPGRKVLAAAIAAFDAVRAGPAMLFLGTVDTHGPWMGHQPWLDRYDPGPYHGVHEEYTHMFDLGVRPGKMGCTVVPPKRDIQRIRAIYDSDISYQDELLGQLVARLEAWGIARETMIIVTADHGEELFEEQRCGHGASLRESLLRVPLLVHYPPLVPGGVVVDEGAEGVDVLPTLLDALDLPPSAQAQGESLLPRVHGVGRGYVRPSYASQYEYAHAMRLGRWKARVGKTGVPDLYDLVADPEERTNLGATHPLERRFVTDVFSTFLVFRKGWKKQSWGVASNMTAQGARALERAAP